MVFCEACNTHISGLQNLVQHYDGRKHKNNFENLTNSTIVRHLEGVDGLVGLEYVIELAHAPKEICMCLLCIKKCDKHEIVSHLKSSNHVEKYLVGGLLALDVLINSILILTAKALSTFIC